MTGSGKRVKSMEKVFILLKMARSGQVVMRMGDRLIEFVRDDDE